jgi:predicted RNase H-like nuclease (RuvC/YqgF family)
MSEMGGWIWPVAAVVIGLALGIVLGAWRQRAKRREPPADSGLPADAAPSGRESTPQQRLLERLRAANLQLSAQMKSLAEANSRQQQEREQERQADRLRHEREIEEVREKHASELAHLMKTLVEQVDGLNKRHAEQLKLMETELERARQDSRRSTHSAPGTLSGGATRPLPMATPAAPAGRAPAAPGAEPPPSDYAVTLPMESFKER